MPSNILIRRFLNGQMVNVDGTVYVFGSRGTPLYTGTDDSVSTHKVP